MGLLYKAFFYHSDLEIMTTELKLCIIRNLENKINLLKNNGVKFIFVIDGKILQCKKNTNKKREKKRKYFLKKSEKLEKTKNYDIGENSLLKKYSKKLPKEIIHFFIDYLIYKKIDFIISPYESDSQLIYMYNKKEIDYIMSEDSDMVIYGCFNIVKGMDKLGNCYIVDKNILYDMKNKIEKNKNGFDNKNEKIEKALKFFFLGNDEKIEFGIFCGCDYLENIKGLGFSRVLKFFPDKINDFKKIIKKKIQKKGKNIFPESLEKKTENGYFELFEYVKASFSHMIVYNKRKNKLVFLKKLKNFFEKDFILKNFIGDKNDFKDFFIKDFVEGKINLETFEKRKKSNFDFEKTLDFINSYQESNFLLNNLSTKTLTFTNFKEFEKINNKKKIKME